MKFQPEDRVRCVENFYDDVLPGETGVVLERFTDNSCHVIWDEYSSKRHSHFGKCAEGHGWSVPDSILELEKAEDFGDLPVLDISDILCI